jgi:ATP-dependent helicase/nuclease subunit B
VASRWLQRLAAYAGTAGAATMTARGETMLSLARRLDEPATADQPRRPRPSPPIELRPHELPATPVETLIRDPYAVYARFVLKLRPFEAVAELPGAAERGTLIHAILEAFIRERPSGPYDAAAYARLVEIATAEFAAYADFPEIGTLWWPRFERIARWFIAAEATRSDIVERLVEGKGRHPLAENFALGARADRLDRLADGTLAIVDYKTGTPPTVDEVLSLSPQLPLEAVIAKAGGFAGIPATGVGRLEYYHLSGRDDGGAICPRGFREGGRKPEVTLADCIALTETRLAELVAYFSRPDAEYLSRKVPKQGRVFRGDYDHLARVAEWTIAEAADAELQ